MDGGDAFIYLNDFYYQGDWGSYSDLVTRLFLGDWGYSVVVVKTYPSLWTGNDLTVLAVWFVEN